jgi:hypothetical protein
LRFHGQLAATGWAELMLYLPVGDQPKLNRNRAHVGCQQEMPRQKATAGNEIDFSNSEDDTCQT